MIKDLFSIFMARYCLGCGKMLREGEQVLCVECREGLCETGFERIPDNPLERLLANRCELKAAASLFFFEKGKLAQLLIHELKYEAHEEIGDWLGLWLGERLAASGRFADVDVVIPVPLHPKKLEKRGYNQVSRFGKALARAINVTFDEVSLLKTTVSTTQTRKFVWKRHNDNNHIFAVIKPENLSGKHVLLVDDVITTGSTIERCYQELVKVPDVKVSVAAIACAVVR